MSQTLFIHAQLATMSGLSGYGLVEEAAIVPLGYVRLHLLVKPWVKRFPTSAMKQWFWKDVVIEPH